MPPNISPATVEQIDGSSENNETNVDVFVYTRLYLILLFSILFEHPLKALNLCAAESSRCEPLESQ